MMRHPTLRASVEENINKWSLAVRPSSLASADWLFGCCPPEALAAMAVDWKPGIVSEGEMLVDNGYFKSNVSIVLRGKFHVVTRHLVGEQSFEKTTEVGAGGVINSIALLKSDDSSRDYSNFVVEAEAASSCLILTIEPDKFIRALTNADKLAPEPNGVPWLSRLRNVARERAKLLSEDGMVGMKALPSAVDEPMELRILAKQAARNGMRVVPRGKDYVTPAPAATAERNRRLGRTEDPDDPTEGTSSPPAQGSNRGRTSSVVSAVTPTPRVLPPPAPLTQSDMDKLSGIEWSVSAQTAKVLRGELQAERIDGARITLKEGSTFSTPLPAELGDLPLGTTTCVVKVCGLRGLLAQCHHHRH